jgi:hypothetical protein
MGVPGHQPRDSEQGAIDQRAGERWLELVDMIFKGYLFRRSKPESTFNETAALMKRMWNQKRVACAGRIPPTAMA